MFSNQSQKSLSSSSSSAQEQLQQQHVHLPGSHPKSHSSSGVDVNIFKNISLKSSLADIRHSYAITGHKSQGSTYDNAFIDIQDISTMPEIS